MRNIRIDETVWKVVSIAPVSVAARGMDDTRPEVPESGLQFTNDRGDKRFLPMSYPALPSAKDLDALPLDDLLQFFSRAR